MKSPNGPAASVSDDVSGLGRTSVTSITTILPAYPPPAYNAQAGPAPAYTKSPLIPDPYPQTQRRTRSWLYCCCCCCCMIVLLLAMLIAAATFFALNVKVDIAGISPPRPSDISFVNNGTLSIPFNVTFRIHNDNPIGLNVDEIKANGYYPLPKTKDRRLIATGRLDHIRIKTGSTQHAQSVQFPIIAVFYCPFVKIMYLVGIWYRN